MSHWLYNRIAGFMLPASTTGSMAQRGEVDHINDRATPSLAPMADRVRNIDRQQILEPYGSGVDASQSETTVASWHKDSVRPNQLQ